MILATPAEVWVAGTLARKNRVIAAAHNAIVAKCQVTRSATFFRPIFPDNVLSNCVFCKSGAMRYFSPK